MDTIVSVQADVNEVKRKFVDAPANLQPKLSKLQTTIERETDFEPSPAYWRALWEKAEHCTESPRQTLVKVQVQGSVVRTKKLSPKAQEGATFERGWNQKPDDWGENFLLDGYDRLNPHDRAQYVKKPRSGNKSVIKEFSQSSRRNLIDRMCSLRVEEWTRSQFITVTYHNQIPEPKRAKANLRAFFKRVCDYCKRHGLDYRPAMIWRIEPQLRGAPHFHLFLFNAPKIPKYMLLEWWQKIAEDPTITQVDREFLTTRRKAMNYLAKYISKPDEGRIDKESGEIAIIPVVEAADFETLKRDVIARAKMQSASERLKKLQKKELPAAAEINPASIIEVLEGCSSDEGALLDIALYWAKAGRYWGSEGITESMYAPINEVVVEITHDGLLRFVALLEQTFPFLVDRWSFGFRLFTYDQPADSIWAIAQGLLSPVLARSSIPDIDFMMDGV